jgi:transglutaminase-like putative cysteine protease
MELRRLVPWTVLPLALIATGLAGAPWLRAFPAATMAVPLFGAAALSVLIPTLVRTLVTRSLALTALADLVGFVLYTLLIVLREPLGFGDLVDGLHHGPSQLLSFALPLVSPPTLLVAPVALCWAAGTLAGESLARARASLLPYAGWLVCFGLAYAATQRAAPSSNHSTRPVQILLAGGLLVTLALIRTVQVWVGQDAAATASQADSVLPLRGLAVGAVVALVATTAAAFAVHTSAFHGRAATPQRVPAVNQSTPVTPTAFIAALRTMPGKPAQPLLQVTLDQRAPAYFGIASVDFYDGDSWSFNRLFRPSGGVVPADLDPSLAPRGSAVTQHYKIDNGPLATVPWMTYLDRPATIDGIATSVDQDSGMIVPTTPLHPGDSYSVTSRVPAAGLSDLPPTAIPATSAPPIDTQLPAQLRPTLTKVIAALAAETGTPSTAPIAFLQAVAKDLHTNYGLSGAATTSPGPSATVSPAPSPSGTPAATPTATPTAATDTGTSFSEILASVLGSARSATSEQYATLFALIARQLGVPARLVSGFHLDAATSAQTLAAGRYVVTTADAATWVEIPVEGQGWVVVDPSPAEYTPAGQGQSVGAAPSATPSAQPSQNALITNSAGGHAVAKKSTIQNPHVRQNSALPVLGIAAGVLGALVLLAVISLLARKRLRMARRRRVTDPRARVLGAWIESVDLLSESGLRDLATLTSTEIVAATRLRFGPESAARAAAVGDAANTAAYSPASVIDPSSGDAAWQAHTALRRLVRQQLPLGVRVGASLRYTRIRQQIWARGPEIWSERTATPARRRRLGRRAVRGRHR